MNPRDKFSRHFREAQLNFSRLYTLVLTQADLTLPQYALLNLLIATGRVPMTHASKKMYISKPAVTNLVDRLEASRCLKRLAHPKDRRVHLLEIQPKGEQIVRKVQNHIFQILFKTLSRYRTKEQKIIIDFYASLTKMIGAALNEPKKIK
ncbi:MAG: MarR family transcriptional regulator [Candidatus Omnitrophica bacterium]|nr:MarR family transcriptional regulator [Candidatus Omnitrophota bacterium]